MALTFTSWTAYTDDDGNPRTLDWSNFTGQSPYAIIEALRQAAWERYQALVITVPNIIPSGVFNPPAGVLNDALVLNGGYPYSTGKATYPNLDMTATIDLFVFDCLTRSQSYYTGFAVPVGIGDVLWTDTTGIHFADVYSVVGAKVASPVMHSPDPPPYVVAWNRLTSEWTAWARQMYEIMRRFVWVTVLDTSGVPPLPVLSLTKYDVPGGFVFQGS